MTEFASVVEFRADLQRRFDSHDAVLRAARATITEFEREQEMVALQIATVDQVMAMQKAVGFGPVGFGPATKSLLGDGDTVGMDGARDAVADAVNGTATSGMDVTAGRDRQPAPPRQRQDVRGPVLALIRNSATELSADEICALLPDLNPPSVRAALKAASRMGTIGEEGGLYFKRASATPTPEEAALAAVIPTAPAQPDDRQGEDSDRHPHDIDAVTGTADDQGLYHTERSVPRYPNTFAHTTEPDPRALANDTPEEQARALRAAIEKAGAVGVDEDNACVAPDVIAAGIAAGWLSRGEDDKGIMRLRIAEQQEAE